MTHFIKKFLFISFIFSNLSISAVIESDSTSSVGSDSSWQTGISLPSNNEADNACAVTSGIPFSCTLPTSGADTVSCQAISLPDGVTLTNSCVLAGTKNEDFSIEVSFDDGVNDAVSKIINLTASVNQDPTASDPLNCSDPDAGSSWTCSLADSASDPESQNIIFLSNSNTPSWVSINGTTLSGTPTSSGEVDIQYSISDGVNTINHTYTVTVNINTANIILGSNAVTSENLSDAGVSADFLSALNGSGCGNDGTSNCLTIFNSGKSSTSCSLGGGASASAAQIEAYALCVIVENATTTSASIATNQPASNASAGCSANVSQQINLPSMCGYSAWRCYVSNAHSDWNVLSNTGPAYNGGGPAAYAVSIPGNTTATGTVNLSIAMKLAPNYSDHLIKTVSIPVNVQTAIANAVNGKKHFTLSSGQKHDYGRAWDSCNEKGGRLATKTETNGTNGNSIFQPNGITGKLVRGGKPSGGWNGLSCYGQGEGYPAHMTKAGANKISCNRYGQWMWCNTDGWGCSQTAGNRAYTCVDLPSCPSN